MSFPDPNETFGCMARRRIDGPLIGATMKRLSNPMVRVEARRVIRVLVNHSDGDGRAKAPCQLAEVLLDVHTTDRATSSLLRCEARAPLNRHQRNDAEQRRRHEVVARRQRIASLCDQPGRNKRGEAAEDH
jgi:hypothetical protein